MARKFVLVGTASDGGLVPLIATLCPVEAKKAFDEVKAVNGLVTRGKREIKLSEIELMATNFLQGTVRRARFPV